MIVEDLLSALEQAVPLQGLLGYVNFSEGRADARFQKQLSDSFATLSAAGAEPHTALHEVLSSALDKLHAGQGEAFRNVDQARAVLDLVFKHAFPAYRTHQRDLLSHQSDAELLQPFFIARVFEAVLSQRGPWDETKRVIEGTLKQLNDYVGHRPIAILETRPKGEPYDHERVRPIPLLLRGAGVAWGRYQKLIEQALSILQTTDENLLRQASLDPSLMDELAMDPRAYDFGHPADKRPNYSFGEWDPHHIDNQGRYRRFVVRQVALDALLDWIKTQAQRDQEEVLAESAAVLAGTLLMASGVSGSGPGMHESSTNLAVLVPRIAKYRDAFYAQLLERTKHQHLHDEAKRTRQPFGGVRQHLNHYFAGRRALQLQQRRLALLFARLGYPEAARRQAAKIPVTSTRTLTEINLRLAIGQLQLDRGEVAATAKLLPEIEGLLHRGIDCGALVDPWNILGFQNQFPRFTSMEDSVRDHRIDELTDVMQQLFHLYARVLSEGAAGKTPSSPQPSPPRGEGEGTGDLKQVSKSMRSLAKWWDRFATLDVSEVTHINGAQEVASAEHVAGALALWCERGSQTADLAFWREQREGFRTPKAFALVVDALLQKEDFRAAMALLMTWLENAEQVPLEEGEHSFHTLALRWMLGACKASDAGAIIPKFFDYLEANADELWNVPRLDLAGVGDTQPNGDKDETESLYSAAYENVSYKDSTDDDVDAEVLDIMPQKNFDLSAEADRLEDRLQFNSTVARLWNIAVRGSSDAALALALKRDDRLVHWHQQARDNFQKLLTLLDRIHEHEIPRPSGSHESLVEYDRRRAIKERLLGQVIGSSLDSSLAVGAIEGVLGPEAIGTDENRPPWQPQVVELERALRAGDAARTKALLPEFVPLFRKEPLLYSPLEYGGHPRLILRASLAQAILRSLVVNLPRLGLVRDTFELIRTAREMELEYQGPGPRVTEFDRLCVMAAQAVADAVVEASRAEEPPQPRQERHLELAVIVEAIIEPFLTIWLEHSKGLRVSVLEMIPSDRDWEHLRAFMTKYGKGLFTAKFLTLGNLRGLVHRGMSAFLDRLTSDDSEFDPSIPLARDLDAGLDRAEADKWLQLIVQTLIENYEEYRDYNQTTTQSDYGENLFQLFEFLRLKAAYDRHAWMLRLLANVHETLARREPKAAQVWRDRVEVVSTELADEHLKNLAALEQRYGMRLRTITDRLEDRFVRTLDQNRLVALIAPAMEQAKQGQADAAVKLEKEVETWGATPVGVGLEVPQWISRLEGEVHRVRNARSALVHLAERVFNVPRVKVPLQELYEQVKDWNKEE